MQYASKFIKSKLTVIFVSFKLAQIYVIILGLMIFCTSCNPATWFIAEEVAERGIEDIEKGEEDRLKEPK